MTIEQEILDASILIVDDQAANVSLLTRLLAQAGYTRVAATLDPAEVVALHRQNAYDLILLDLQMPGIDGFGVMAGLKVNTAEGYLPVIVLTAQPGHKLRALEAGARDFISKPFDLVEATTRIRNMLEVRLLYRQLAAHNQELERLVQARTAELLDSETRYRSLTELASDWYWEQDADGVFTRVSGPVLEMLGVREPLPGAEPAGEGAAAAAAGGWDPAERQTLRGYINERRPFLDFGFHRTMADGSRRNFRVSGEPVFDNACRFKGYRGIGVEVTVGR
jgi:CheY-like chemotaxis protein